MHQAVNQHQLSQNAQGSNQDSAKPLAAITPQMPQKPWTGLASTGSSIFSFTSNIDAPVQHMTPNQDNRVSNVSAQMAEHVAICGNMWPCCMALTYLEVLFHKSHMTRQPQWSHDATLDRSRQMAGFGWQHVAMTWVNNGQYDSICLRLF